MTGFIDFLAKIIKLSDHARGFRGEDVVKRVLNTIENHIVDAAEIDVIIHTGSKEINQGINFNASSSDDGWSPPERREEAEAALERANVALREALDAAGNRLEANCLRNP